MNELLIEMQYLQLPSHNNDDPLNQTFDAKELHHRTNNPLLSPNFKNEHYRDLRVYSNKSQSASQSRPRTPSALNSLKSPSLLDAYTHLKNQRKLVAANNALIVKKVSK